MADQSDLEDRISGLLFFPKTDDGKRAGIQLWSESVMKDAGLSRAAVRVAWGLTFRLDAKARTFERRELLAKRISLNGSTVDKAMKELRQRGHVIVRIEPVNFPGKPSRRMTVTRPCFSWLSGGGYNPHSGGGDSTHPEGGDSAHPCNQKGNRKKKPFNLQRVRIVEATEEFQDYEDWEGLPP